MPEVRNISTGPRGAYKVGTLVMVNPGEVIEADDFAPEWFELAYHPLDHDGDGRKGGSRRGRKPKVDAEPEGEAEAAAEGAEAE